MTIKCSLTAGDIIRLSIIRTIRSPWFYASITVCSLLLFVLLLFAAERPYSSMTWAFAIVLCVIGGALLTTAFMIYSLLFILMIARLTKGALGPQEYFVGEEGFREKNLATDTLYKWSGVRSIRKIGPYITVRVSFLMECIIPARSLHPEGEFDAFLAAARSAWETGRGRS